MGKKRKRRNRRVRINFETEAHFYIANQSSGTMEIKTKLRPSLQFQHFFMSYVNSNRTWKKKCSQDAKSEVFIHTFVLQLFHKHQSKLLLHNTLPAVA